MRNHKLNYVIVGLFVVSMLAAAGITAMVLTGRTGESDFYYLVLDNVADVRFGTQVRYEGFPVGQVEEITPFAEGGAMRFRLDLSVTRGWRIPEDSIARIGSSSFLAAKTIDVESGRAETALAPDSEIPGAPPIGRIGNAEKAGRKWQRVRFSFRRVRVSFQSISPRGASANTIYFATVPIPRCRGTLNLFGAATRAPLARTSRTYRRPTLQR